MKRPKNNHKQQQRVKFGGYLKELVRKRWKRQKVAALELGISAETLSYILRGKRQAPDELLTKISEKCNVPLEDILTRKYWPQMLLLSGIIEPSKITKNLLEELDPPELEEITRYAAMLLLKRYASTNPMVTV